MDYKVLITTSGTGSRLGELTKSTNKALVTVGGKTVISHIVEGYDVETKFVVTIGYHGDQVRDFLQRTYPDRVFEFVEVDKYVGEGSSLGYSMLCARAVLQCPFIFHCNDTIVSGVIPVPAQNWIGLYRGNDALQYASWKLGKDGELQFQDKGAVDFDFIHIGLVGIYDYALYWDTLAELYAQNPGDQSLNDCKVLVRMQAASVPFLSVEFSQWHDTGNVPALEKAITHLGG